MQTRICPSLDQLSEYALGKLSDADLMVVADHIESCPECQLTVTEASAASDTLIGGLQGGVKMEPFSSEPALARALAAVQDFGVDDFRIDENESRGSAMSDEFSRHDDAVPLESIREYRLLDKLGEGGMGTVYRALHTKLQRIVALKVLPKRRLKDTQAVARFGREMQAVARLDHANIVRAHDAGEVDGTHFLVMEFVDGIDLSKLVDQVGRLSVADACELVRQAAMGLQHAHESGLVHRDVKPSNLMLGRDGVVRILDLGLARLHEDSADNVSSTPADDSGESEPCRVDEAVKNGELTGTDQLMGTPDYMAPEQYRGSRGVDIRADIYSLGATLYKLLTGHAPYSGPEYDSLAKKVRGLSTKAVPPVTRYRGDLPQELISFLQTMLAKDPAQRPRSPSDVVEVLRPFCDRADVHALLMSSASGAIDHTSADRRVKPRSDAANNRPVPVPWVRRWRWWNVALTGLAAAMAVGLMIVLLSIRTRQGILEVSVDESVRDNVSIVVRRGGEEVIISDDTGWQVSLNEGNWTVELKDGLHEFELDKTAAQIKRGDTAMVRVELKRRVDRVPATSSRSPSQPRRYENPPPDRDNVANAVARAPSTIELRIVPNLGDSAREPRITNLAQYIDALHQRGARGKTDVTSKFRWFETVPDIGGKLPHARHDGRTYALLCDEPPFVVTIDRDGESSAVRSVEVERLADGSFVGRLLLDDTMARRMTQLTEDNVENSLAVVVNDKVVSVRRIASPIGAEVQLTGNYLADEELAAFLHALGSGHRE